MGLPLAVNNQDFLVNFLARIQRALPGQQGFRYRGEARSMNIPCFKIPEIVVFRKFFCLFFGNKA